LLEVTTQSPVTTESLTEENDVIIPVQGVEMVTETVLSYRPLSGVSSHSHDHHGEFSRTVFTSGDTAEKVLVFIPRAGLRGLEVSTVWSWVSAGFTILQCIPTPNPGHGLTSLASHRNTTVMEFLTKLEPQPRDVVLLGAGLGANIGLLMDLTPYSQLVLVDLEPSLPGMVWSRPHFLSRAFPSPGPAIPPETVAAAWRVSPLYMVGGVKHNVLLVTTEDPQLVRIYQNAEFDSSLRGLGVDSEHYHSHGDTEITRLALGWLDRKTNSYHSECQVPDRTRPTSSTGGGVTKGPVGPSGGSSTGVSPGVSPLTLALLVVVSSVSCYFGLTGP